MAKEKIKFCVDREKMEITYYLTETQMRKIAKEAVKNNKSCEQVADILTEMFYQLTKGLCNKLNIDFNKLKPKLEFIKE